MNFGAIFRFGGAESSPRINQSDFGGHLLQTPDPGSLNANPA